VAPTGSVRLGDKAPTPTRLTIERPTDKGRLLTVVCDTPVLFLGAGLPDAKPKAGYDFAVLDIEMDGSGNGSGTLAPAAKVTVKNGAFVVDDYGSEVVRLTDVKKTK
jgi:putative intracellular protease/amidase